MKKNLFFFSLAAAMMLSACTDDAPSVNSGGEVAPEGGKFLAVNIVSQGGTESRAGESNEDISGNPYGNKFEDGTDNENAVTAVRFYFFTATGDAVSIKKGSKVNYYDVTDQIATDSPSENHSETVERILKAVVIVEPGERVPAKVAVVINPILGDKTVEPNTLGDQSLSLSELQARCVNYASYANRQNKFIMSNSVYSDANGVVDATAVTSANFHLTKEDAEANPVEIYVERAVAKVRVSAKGLEKSRVTTTSDGKILYQLYRAKKDEKGNIIGSEDYKIGVKVPEKSEGGSTGNVQSNGYEMKQVYLKLEGWDVTADLSRSWFFKKINRDWSPTYLGSDINWNDPAHNRSYWADECNPTNGTNENNYYAYNDANHFKYYEPNPTDGNHFKPTLFDGKVGVYCNENAERTGKLKLVNTKVLIKGTICDDTGKPYTISEYAGNRFIDNDSLDGLKNRYIEMLKGMRSELPWCKVEEGGKTGYRQLSVADLRMKAVEYVDPEDLNPEQPAQAAANGSNTYTVTDGRYYVYPYLTDLAASYTWYATVTLKDDKTYEVGETVPVEDIKTNLLKLSHAMAWKDGQTYYYIDITHIGNKSLPGVVRNHIYDLNLTKIYGVGTPVYSNELIIEPEKPESDETFIAARINILSWRVKEQDVVLDWN